MNTTSVREVMGSTYQYVGTHHFPDALCRVKNGREAEVLDSTDDDYHLVVLVDRRFPVNLRIAKMRPYLFRDDDNDETCFGWVDEDGNIASHGEHPVYDLDNAKVLAWKPCAKGLDLRK